MGRKKGFEIEELLAEDISSDGRAVGRYEEQVVFVEGMVPGDKARVRVKRKRKKYLEGWSLGLVEPSAHRIDPVCDHFGVCGGCKWQHLAYEKLVTLKQKHVSDSFRKIGGIEIDPEEILPAPRVFEYRNKLEYTFSNKRWITEEEVASGVEIEDGRAVGFHIPGRFDKVVDVKKCHLQVDVSNKIRNGIRKFALENGLSFYDLREHKGHLRTLIIRTSSLNELMTVVVFGEPGDHVDLVMSYISGAFPEITSLNYVINQKKNDTISDQEVICYKGEPFIWEIMGDLKFKIRPKSFFQTNKEQAENLYAIALEFADLNKEDVLYDLYSGTGTIGLSCANHVQKVVGVEYVEDAVKDAHENAETNGISNAAFFSGDLKDLLDESFVAEHGKPNVVICDPPRAGMHADVVNQLLKMAPERIVYVSCNPSTQARDVALMLGAFTIERSRAVDMFPQTAHVENVVLLKRNGA